ncbi:flagellar hook-length control protein FliK [Cupriavidus sp. CuC1]|uniref:flagellar hook-length control protein FliK n=1 Tax=Cupriavidus sp. CuC1 TaxID=3373131 RepID=UPI0037D2DFCE
MTGIPISPDPAALLRGADPQGLRNALSVSKLAALLPTGKIAPGENQTAGGGTIQGRGVDALQTDAAAAGRSAQTGSTRETLSFAARTILDLLDRTDAQPARAAAPMLPSPAGAPNPAVLRAALAELVQHSGLFYESHLAEWVSGNRPLADVLKAPQAAFNQPMPGEPALAGNPGAPRQPVQAPPVLLLPAPAGYTASTAQLAGAALSNAAGAAQAEVAVMEDTGGNPAPVKRGAANSNGTLDSTPASLSGPPHAREAARLATLANQAAQAYQAAAQDASDSGRSHRTEGHSVLRTIDSGEAGNHASSTPQSNSVVHPGTEGTVRQQLELLASQQFRWVGEAWPGTPMDWEIRRGEKDENSSAQAGPAPWSTRLLLTLPSLGTVEARLWLSGTGLEARLVTPDSAVASRLNDARSELSSNMSANGLVLMRLNVETGVPAKPGSGA